MPPGPPSTAGRRRDRQGSRAATSIAVYVGRMTSSVPASSRPRPRSSASSSDGMTSSRSAGSPPYAILRPSSAARSPVAMTSPACSSSGSKSTSQIHDTSWPSAIASFSAMTSTGGTPISSVRTTSFAPAGFLMSRRTTDLPPAGIRSNRPNAALKRDEAGADVLERRADGQRRATPRPSRCRRCRDRAARARSPPRPRVRRGGSAMPEGRAARCPERRRRARGDDGRTADSGSRRDAPRTPPRTRTVRRSGRSTSSRRRAAGPIAIAAGRRARTEPHRRARRRGRRRSGRRR